MKAYAYLAAVLALLGALWGVYHMGGAGCREASANAARESRERQDEDIAKLERDRPKREVIYRDKIRIVEQSTAACLGVPMLDADRLQLSGGSEAKPRANP